MYRFVLAPIGLALALGACNQGPSVSLKNASIEEVDKANKAAGIEQRPGMWESRIDSMELEMNGTPMPQNPAVKEAMSKPQSQCLTEEMLKNANPQSYMPKGVDCTFRDYNKANGTISGTLACNGPMGEMVSKISGSYTADSSETRVEMTSTGPDGRTMKQKMKMTARRTGDCTSEKKG